MKESFKISSIISEFNPFHLGHQSLIVQTKQTGASHIVAIMSGNFVQRGEPACFDKWIRTKAALSAGVDLVVELPLPWAISGAETFAKGGVFLANALGCVNELSFGSECGNLKQLTKIANLLSTPAFSSALQVELKKGISFAAARQKAIAFISDEKTASLLEQPNNILAIAYCKALAEMNTAIKPFTIKRVGAAHNDQVEPNEKIASASQIRHMILKKQAYSSYIPKETCVYLKEALSAKCAPSTISMLEIAILAKLRTMTIADFANLPDVSEGLEHRLYKAVKLSTNLNDFYDFVKTKRYTHARIRRIVLSAFLGVKEEHTSHLPPYIHVLGFNENGKQVLNLAKQTASLPIITQYSQVQALTAQAKTIFHLESTATDLYNLSTPRPQPCGKELTHGIVTV